MYLVIDPEASCYVFVRQDPRPDGCTLPVDDGVTLVENAAPNTWDSGDMDRTPYLGRSPADPHEYRIFNSDYSCQVASFQPLGEDFQTVDTWKQYLEQSRERKDHETA